MIGGGSHSTDVQPGAGNGESECKFLVNFGSVPERNERGGETQDGAGGM